MRNLVAHDEGEIAVLNLNGVGESHRNDSEALRSERCLESGKIPRAFREFALIEADEEIIDSIAGAPSEILGISLDPRRNRGVLDGGGIERLQIVNQPE